MYTTFAEAQILLKTKSAIPRRTSPPVQVAEVFSGMTGVGISDGNNSTGTPDTISELIPVAAAWDQNPYTLAISDLSFARFAENGRVYFGASSPQNPQAELAGFYLTPRTAALDCKIGSNAGAVDGGNTDLNWIAVNGLWKTLAKLEPDGGTGIQNYGTASYSMARTLGTLPANRGIRLRFQLNMLPSQGGLPAARVRWGDVWALRMPHGKMARLERLVSKTQTVNGNTVITKKWQTVKELSGTKPVNARGGKYQVSIFRLAGRLVVIFNGVGHWFYVPGDTPADKPKEVSWIESPVWLEAGGLRFVRAELATIKWSSPGGVPYDGYIERVVPRQTAVDPDAESTGDCAGWKLAGTKASVTPSVVDGGVKYRLDMTASRDGIDTPFTDKASTRFKPIWTNPTPPAEDVRFATRVVSVSQEMGPDVTGAEATIELDRVMLDFKFPNWQQYAQLDCPVEIRLKRTGSDFSTVFSGYIAHTERMGNANGDRILKLTCRDKLHRLQKVGDVYNAIVDHRCMPLDLLFAEQLRNAFDNGGYTAEGYPVAPYNGLYYADCFKAIVELFLGYDEANRINGNGDPTRFYGVDHPPILSPNNDIGGWLELAALSGEPIAAGGFILPPPFWESACDWLKQIAQKDRCTFFYGWPPGYEGDEPCLVYGRIPRILRAQGLRLHVLRDVVVNGSRERMLAMASTERRSERAFNRLVVAGPDEPGLAGLRPSLSIDEFNLENSESNAAWRSWEKTVLLREPLAYLIGRAIGEGVMQLMQGVDLQWPTFEVDGGDERISIGHLVKVDFSGVYADESLGLGEQMFRAENVTHTCVFTEASGLMSTTIRPRPLNAEEDRAFRHVVSIGGVVESTPDDGVPTDVETIVY